MKMTKIFDYEGCQVVQIPKEYRFTSNEVIVNKVGDVVMLVPKNAGWNPFMRAVDMFSEDFMKDGRPAQGIQERA